ncbi:zinc finger MYND domain-containing protein 15-like [Anguilla rostrata]|uniref:zinc finger MYND domain-containing protein 15-like n=1 Tax=Anguilla rostrata TaxID=7938 RepID=UPI0030CD062C
MERFLTQNRLDHGYWVHWSLLVRSPHFLLHSEMDHSGESSPTWLTGHADPYGPLRAESDILLSCPGKGPRAPSLTAPLVCWLQYCKWRGLSLSSPVAALLSSPLSIYYIMTSLVPRDFPELNILKKKSLKIHIIESNREFQSLLVFWELAMLLPHVTFELLFIGEGLPQECDEQQFLLQQKGDRLALVCPSFAQEDGVGKRSIRVRGYRRAYHMLQGPKPDLVIGFRPAFRLHDFWLSTLPRLQSLKVPAYFCEDNELSCVCSQQVMGAATGGALSPPHINPFHSPLRVARGDNRLPWYSNAFVFHLIYKTVAACPQRVPLARPRPCDPAQPLPPANQKPPAEGSKMTRKERKQAARNIPRKRK